MRSPAPADMTRPLAFSAVCIALVAFAFLSQGCKSVPLPAPIPRTNPAAAIIEGKAKDEAIDTEARAIVAAPTDSVMVSAAAARILDVLRLSPWSKTETTIKALLSERDTAITSAKTQGEADAKTIADLRAQLDKANSRTDQIIRLGLAGFGAVLIAGAIIVAILAVKAGGIFVGVGPAQSGAIGAAGVTLIFCSFAYGWALRNQTLVMSVFGACLVAAVAFWYSNRKHAAS